MVSAPAAYRFPAATAPRERLISEEPKAPSESGLVSRARPAFRDAVSARLIIVATIDGGNRLAPSTRGRDVRPSGEQCHVWPFLIVCDTHGKRRADQEIPPRFRQVRRGKR